MSSYPGAVRTFTTKNAGDTIQPADVNDLQDEVNALEAGILNGTAHFKSSNSTVNHLSVVAGANIVGNSTFGSTITIGAQTYIFPSSGGSTGQVMTCISTNGSTMTLEWRNQSSPLSIITSGTGLDSNGSAANMATAAISGLTANDALEVRWTVSAVGNTISDLLLYHNTDASTLVRISQAAITAGVTAQGQALIQNSAVNSTSIASVFFGYTGATFVSTGLIASSIATGWTGSWTLALRHSGITAGGSAKWSWTVYKKAAQ